MVLIILFLVLALITGSLTFAGVTIISLGLLRILFFVFFGLFLISLIMRLVSGDDNHHHHPHK